MYKLQPSYRVTDTIALMITLICFVSSSGCHEPESATIDGGRSSDVGATEAANEASVSPSVTHTENDTRPPDLATSAPKEPSADQLPTEPAVKHSERDAEAQQRVTEATAPDALIAATFTHNDTEGLNKHPAPADHQGRHRARHPVPQGSTPAAGLQGASQGGHGRSGGARDGRASW